MDDERITISRCPLCKGAHSYKLDVEYSTISYRVEAFGSGSGMTPRRFTRLFTCPVKNDEFQATIALYESTDMPISSVSVAGLETT